MLDRLNKVKQLTEKTVFQTVFYFLKENLYI